ncbi:MAG: phosphate acyltransferase PlsX [Thermotogota bacterium]|nr:phosphate acyltransferase PlsX [Thermotogota bacterium]
MAIIAIDAMGGDHAPQAIIKGVEEAKSKNIIKSGIILVGKKDQIEKYSTQLDQLEDVTIYDAPGTFKMDEKPSHILRRRETSLYMAADLIKTGKADALISAGNTGALLAVSTFVIGRIKGISRPAIASPIPNKKGYTILLDSGANLESKIENYLSFARMGLALQRINGIDKPKVGLLNVGSEEDKGTDQIKEAYKLMKEELNHNFIGFVEGRDIASGTVDVVVTDGWSGNIALKSMEGIGNFISSLLKSSINARSIMVKLGALLMKPVFADLKFKTDSRNTGGGYILGVNAPSIKAHGNSDSIAIINALKVAEKGIDNEIVQKIQHSMD